jgi:hypothetical protein
VDEIPDNPSQSPNSHLEVEIPKASTLGIQDDAAQKSEDILTPTSSQQLDPVVKTLARIAVYDDFLSAPRIIDIEPAPILQFIEQIAITTYDRSSALGGRIPYSIIREMTENFIHAEFKECTVSIMSGGNTIRFSDQGPGIEKKLLVQQPGVSSASDAMRHYIKGVGSGFPLVREYLNVHNGVLSIDDNALDGVVITLSLDLDVGAQPQPFGQPAANMAEAYRQAPGRYRPATSSDYLTDQDSGPMPTAIHPDNMGTNAFTGADLGAQVTQTTTYDQTFITNSPESVGLRSHQYGIHSDSPEVWTTQTAHTQMSAPDPAIAGQAMVPEPALDERSRKALKAISVIGAAGPTDLAKPLGVSSATAHRLLQALEKKGLLTKTMNRKRILSNYGLEVLRRTQ